MDGAVLQGSEESAARTDIVVLCGKAQSTTTDTKLSLQRACVVGIRLKPLC